MPRPRCGTEAAFQRHQDLGHSACAPCWDAHEVALANRRERRRRRAGHPVNPLQYRLALRGQEPAEALVPADRELLVRTLVGWGWRDLRIAELTSMTTYTTARIRERLGLAAHPAPARTAAPARTTLDRLAARDRDARRSA